VAGGRCYVAGDCTLYCVDAGDGHEIWKTKLPGDSVSSSPLVVDDTVVLLAGAVVGYRVGDGNQAWSAPAKPSWGNSSSPSLWVKDGNSYVVCNAGSGVSCVDPRSGQVLWNVKGGGNSTVAIDGDIAVVMGDKEDVGLVAYHMSLEPNQTQKLWSVQMLDFATTPVIYQGNVYVMGANRIGCYGLADGAIKWEHMARVKELDPVSLMRRDNQPDHDWIWEVTSPIVADGKLIGLTGGMLNMLKPSPEGLVRLAAWPKPDVSLCATPSVAGGKLYLRLNNAFACYDLPKK
jgi:outer membrane protein assembly factor BamB